MKLKIASALVASAALLPVSAQGQAPGYSYLDLAYVETDFDRVRDNADGFALRGSFELTDSVFMFADYTEQSVRNVDFEAYNVGFGYAWSIAPNMDLYGKLAYVKAEARGFGLRGDDDGYGASVGIRSFVTGNFELEGAVDYVDLSDSGDDTSFGIAARWYFTPQFAIGAEAKLGDDANSYGIGVRWNFGG
jgi:hypothetical protein